MGWRMKNFNIFGVYGKIRVLEGGHEKPIYRGDCLKKGGAWIVFGFRGGLGKKDGVVFLRGEEVDTPMYTMGDSLVVY